MRYLICLLLMVSTSLAAGTIQKWVDEDGNVHYGDAPPASMKTETIRVQRAPTDPGPALPRLSDEAAEQEGDQQISSEEAALACENARNDLEVINNNTRIRLQENDGNVRYLSEAEIAERRSMAEADVDRFCN